MQTLKKKTTPVKGKGTKTVNFNATDAAEIKAHNEMAAAMNRKAKRRSAAKAPKRNSPSYNELLEKLKRYETKEATLISKLRAQHDDPDTLKKIIRSSDEALMTVAQQFEGWDLMSETINEVGHWFSTFMGSNEQEWKGVELSNTVFHYVRLTTFLAKVGEIVNEKKASEAQLQISKLIV